jgi:hypothetical protein
MAFDAAWIVDDFSSLSVHCNVEALPEQSV